MKLVDLAMYLVYIATYSIVVPIGVGTYFLGKLPPALRILWIGQIVVLGLDLLLLLFNLKATVTFLYLFSAFDAILMAWLFSGLVRTQPIFWLSSGLMVGLIGIDAFFLSGLTHNGFSHGVEKIYGAVVAVYYLTQLVQDETVDDLFSQPMLWVSAGIISYNLVGSFDVFSGPVVNYSRTLYLQYYLFWAIINLMMYIAFTYAFWLASRRR